MDELMRKDASLSQKNHKPAKRELTCSVHFVNPKSSSSSDDELTSVTRLVSNADDLELMRFLGRESGDLVKNRSLFEFGHTFEDVHGWQNIEQPEKMQLKSVLRYMFENHLKTSVQVEINQMYFNCHLVVLQVYSKFFMELAEIPLVVTLPESKVSQKAFMIIYKWMLSDEPQLEPKNIVAVFVAATYLRIEALLIQCWQYFEDVNCFDEATACVLYVESRDNPAMDVVRSLMLTRIHKFLLTFVATRDFLDVPLKHLVWLLSSDEICVNTEVEILFMIVRWLGHDWEQRRCHVPSVIECVRFKLMPLWYLLCVRRDENHKLVRELLTLPKVDAIINKTIAKITSHIYEEKTNGCSHVDLVQFMSNAPQRRWIIDELCPYFHDFSCPNTRNINYKQFEAYLTILQQQPLDSWVKVQMLDLNNPKKCCCINSIRAN